MYILMLSRGVPSAKYPQWGCFEKDQAEALAALGHKVIVLSVDSRFLFSWRKIGITHIVDNGVEYYNLFLCPSVILAFMGRKFNWWHRCVQASFLYNSYIKKQHGIPDILYGHFFSNTLLGIDIKAKDRIPLVGIEHAARFNENVLDKNTSLMAHYVYDHTDAIIAVSESLRRSLFHHFHKDSVVVHNMANRSYFEKEYIVKERDSKLVFVATGSLIYRKGFDLLIAAFDKLKLPADLWELNIIGGGEEHGNLQKQINEVGLQNNIHLLGQKNKEEIVVLLSQSNVFVLPSRNENFSVAVLEALACGLPVIASICGGIRECIEDFNGLLFPVDDADALVDAIKYMFEHYDQYDKKRIAEDCKNRFSPKVIAQQLTHVFEQTIEDFKKKNQ